MSTTYWCELAWLGEGQGGVTAGVAVRVEGTHITGVEADTSPAAGWVRLPGLTVPGFANTHSHAFHRALRGRTHGDGGTFWTWRDQMYALAERLDPDLYLDLATATFAEMALAGVSTVGEFHYVHHTPDGRPYAEPNTMGEALREAAAVAGVRLTLLDACYLSGGIGEHAAGVQRRFADVDVDAWVERVDALPSTATCQIGAAVHSVRAVDPTSAAAVAAWATTTDAPLHVHVSEQRAENDACQAAYGCSPTALLAAHGVLGPRTSAVHCTHLTPADVALLADTGTSVSICPTTERDLADGVGPTGALRGAGVPLHVGTDSNAVIDPLEEIRALELDERLTSGRRGTHSPAELLTMATAAGQASLGWDDSGRIEAGALADLTTITLGSVRLAGADQADALGSVVFAATASDVQHVVIGGEVVVRDGAHLRLDVARALDRSIRAAWS